MSAWVNFQRIKEEARFEPILERYGLTLEPKQGRRELTGLCPFHKDSKPSFSVNLEKKVFHCFGCSAGGGVIEFVARMEQITIRDAAVMIAEWLGIDGALEERGGKRPERKHTNAASEPTSQRSAQTQAALPLPNGAPEKARPPERVEAAHHEEVAVESAELKPLTFTLQGLDPAHPYLAERNVSREDAEEFGIGFCSRGMMKGRVCVPIHDAEGQLVAYLGRWPGEPPEGEPRYKLPPNFPKSKVLYNLHRVQGVEHLVIVEGVWSVLRLHVLRVPAIALMGTSLSEEQASLIAAADVHRITILLDGDDAGRRASDDLASRLARRFFVRVVDLPDGTQPDTIPESELRALLNLPGRPADLPA